MKKEYIPISNITIDGINPRQTIDEESLKDFTESTDEHGMLQPIGVHRFNGSIRLIWGKRRLKAAISRKEERIEAVVYEKEMSDMDLFFLSLTENLHREPLSRQEQRSAIMKLHTEFNLSIRDIAKKLKMKKSYVSDLLQETRYPEDVLKSLDSGSISVKDARFISDEADPASRSRLMAQKSRNQDEGTGEKEPPPGKENAALSKADNFAKKQIERLGSLFGQLNRDNHEDILREIHKVAEQSYKPLIQYGFMESKTFPAHTEDDIKTILGACVEEDVAPAAIYIELNRHILKIIAAAENRVKSFKNSGTTDFTGDGLASDQLSAVRTVEAS